jgi:integrase
MTRKPGKKPKPTPYLFKQKSVTYTLKDGSYRTPDGNRVTRKTPGAVRLVTESQKWYGRLPDGTRRPLSESHEVSKRMLDKLRGDAQLRSVGLEDPFGEHRSRPMLEHLEDFRRFLAARGRVTEHVSSTFRQCQAVIEGCGFKKIDDIQPTAVAEFLAGLQDGNRILDLPDKQKKFTAQQLAALLQIKPESVWRMVKRGQIECAGVGRKRYFTRSAVTELLDGRQGIGISTSNHYLMAMKAFTRWLFRNRRTGVDALASLSRQNEDVDVRHQRRALPADAFEQFIAATGAGISFRGLTGADRLIIYTLAANTGLRAGEIGSLTPASFDLGRKAPSVTVLAGYSKHRRKDVLPLRPDVADMMRRYIAGRPSDQPLWPGTWTKCAAEMVRLDLAAAGLPYEDGQGRVFDFHSTRGQFISLLAAGGVHPKVAQLLARHSTISLTMDAYTHLDVLDVAGALDKLPPLPGAAKPSSSRKVR